MKVYDGLDSNHSCISTAGPARDCW